jgi:hypothetical protein
MDFLTLGGQNISGLTFEGGCWLAGQAALLITRLTGPVWGVVGHTGPIL